MPLMIHQMVLSEIDDAAARAGRQECMGLLASTPGAVTITQMCILPAVASPTRAEASPMALRLAADRFRDAGLVPRGIWHSHGHAAVFHSGTDHGTIERLLPAMAPWNFERPRHAVANPTVTARDEAALPLKDGRIMRIRLVGEALPIAEAYEATGWGRISTAFTDPKDSDPRATYSGSMLELESGGVVLSLAIPEGASVHSSVQDNSSHRVARLYSLVVNTRGERATECLVVTEWDGRCHLQQEPCELLEICDGDEERRDDSLFSSLRRMVVGR
ncbi:MAG: Mov34/MPN/PAD-1 family protein [Acidobacteria bacterium]|nr:Mov34/MPN/PAD-1 family protein [Acidobacteriota bacterium]